jgi:hypothetical protein
MQNCHEELPGLHEKGARRQRRRVSPIRQILPRLPDGQVSRVELESRVYDDMHPCLELTTGTLSGEVAT